MPVKWKLFGLANYVFMFAYIFFSLTVFRFIIEFIPNDANPEPLLPLIMSQVITILNSFFNIHVYHKHLPRRPFKKGKGVFYFISAIFYAIAFTFIVISLFIVITEGLKSRPMDNATYLILSIFFFNLLIGLFILINQFLIIKLIGKKVRFLLTRHVKDYKENKS